MAMGEEALERVCRLALALKDSAHLLLDHHHLLSLDTHTLLEVQDAFSLILQTEQHTHFHVLPPNHRQHPSIPHLQMTYDLLQKVAGLRLWPRRDLRSQHPVSLRCFRSLHTLEVAGVPITQLRALQALRSQLRRIVATRSIATLSDLFVKCGADQAGEYIWEHLLEATLSHNKLEDSQLDDSLKLLPNLRVLDLSHCELNDVTHLRYLSSLAYLDVSHNHLAALPHLPPTSSPSLRVLLASHNELRDLKGLQVMTGLEEVNVSYNLLTSRPDLATLAALPRLKCLTLVGNPVTCDLAYRRVTLALLHPAVAVSELTLDAQLLTQQEQLLIGSLPSPPDLPHCLPSLPTTPSPLHRPPTTPTSPPPGTEGDTQQASSVSREALSRTGQGTRRRSRKGRTRHIALEGEDEGDGETPTTGPPPTIAPTPPTPFPSAATLALDEPPSPPPPSLALETAVPPPEALTQALASLVHTASPRSQQEQNDRLLEEILQAKAFSPATPQQTATSTATTTATSAATDEEVLLVEEEEEKEEEEEEEEGGEAFYKVQEDLERSISDEEDESCLVLAKRMNDEGESSESSEADDVILSITPTHFKEKHGLTTKILYRWELRCVEKVEEITSSTTPSTSTTIHVTFDTTRPSHRSRIYTLEKVDFERLQEALVSPLQELTNACRRCLGQMVHSQGGKVCAQCSKRPMTSTPLPHPHHTTHSLHEDNNNGASEEWSPRPPDDPPQPSAAPPPQQEPPALVMQDSSSSGGSVCTAYERAGANSHPPTPHHAHTTLPPPPPPPDAADGGGSGFSSMYYSVDETLGGAATPQPPSFNSRDCKKDEDEEVLHGGGGRLVSVAPWVESLLHTYTGYHWRWWEDLDAEEGGEGVKEEEENGIKGGTERKSHPKHGLQRPHNPITYNYEDFSHVDHRVRLFLEVALLGDDEHLLGILKAVMVVAGGRREFQGIFVLSSKKYYLLEIIGPEDDSPHSWLEEVLRGDLTSIEVVYSLYQRQGVALGLAPTTPTPPPTPSVLLLCVADSHRANCFFSFLMEALGGEGVSPTLVEAAQTQEEAVLELLKKAREEEEAEEEEEEVRSPSLFCVVSLLQGGGCSESQFLVINEKDLILYAADLTWYLPSAATSAATTTATSAAPTTLAITATQKIHNVTAIEVHSPHHLSIDFLDEVTQKESNWQLHLATPLQCCQLVEAVRVPWSHLYAVDLQVTRHSEVTSG